MKKFYFVFLLGVLSVAGCKTDEPTTDGGNPIDQATSDVSAISCPQPTAGPTKHQGHIASDQLWTANTGPHIVSASFGIQKGARLTIEPCTEVRLAPDHGIIVAGPNTPDTGTLIAEGTADKPIRFVQDQTGKRWSSLFVYPGGSARLAYVTLEGGGGAQGPAGTMLGITGDQYQPPQQQVYVNNVTIRDALVHGVFIDGRGGFTADSKNLTITGSGSYPVRMWPNTLGTLPSGNYTGNGVDEILIPQGSGASGISTDTTMHNRGVPYHVGTPTTQARLDVSAGQGKSLATLHIEAGVIVKFEKGGVLSVEPSTGTNPSSGALIATGTQDKPVIFTSAQKPPQPGDWTGIWFGQTPSSTNKLDHVRVDYAGGSTGTLNFSCENPARPENSKTRNEAAILILGLPAGAFVTNSIIANSASDGIERGWIGEPIDFIATNSFEGITYCKQSYPRPASGSCPSPVPCEK